MITFCEDSPIQWFSSEESHINDDSREKLEKIVHQQLNHIHCPSNMILPSDNDLSLVTDGSNVSQCIIIRCPSKTMMSVTSVSC